jgi:hypothetical protein
MSSKRRAEKVQPEVISTSNRPACRSRETLHFVIEIKPGQAMAGDPARRRTDAAKQLVRFRIEAANVLF